MRYIHSHKTTGNFHFFTLISTDTLLQAGRFTLGLVSKANGLYLNQYSSEWRSHMLLQGIFWKCNTDEEEDQRVRQLLAAFPEWFNVGP